MATALRHDRRKDIVRYLRANGGTASLTALAFRVATTTKADFPSAMVTLQDLDLPRLVECGLVEQSDEGAVALAVDDERIERILDRTGES